TYKETATINSIVYPNPTSRILTITVGDKNLIGTMASIYDMNGRLIESIKISAQSQTVDISRYTNGIYLIRLDNKETLKVIKQ
ncbi:MAG TPA: T9SS type A sorting domain-containing protein, partial [Chitinophagaceae bacterium]|nr:T9SS type A sorting domain-containing protein [Chitinophagaceae bacterium]